MELIGWDCMRYIVFGMKYNICCYSDKKQSQYSLIDNENGLGVEFVKYDLCYMLLVCFRVKQVFSQEDGVLFWGCIKLIVESVLVDKFQVILISNYVVFYGIFERKVIFFVLSFGFF